MHRYILLLPLLAIALPSGAFARPVSYAGGWMLMSMNDHMEYSNMLVYSPRADYAVGVRSDYMREDKEWLHTAIYNKLLKRWNAPESQGNLFLQTGLGIAQSGSNSNPAASLGLEADWETRRVYVSYENRYVYAGNIESSFSHKARIGIAPYIGGYDDVHTWLMLQIDHHPAERDNIVVTPLVRLFTQDVLGEVGISNKKDVMLNLTWQF